MLRDRPGSRYTKTALKFGLGILVALAILEVPTLLGVLDYRPLLLPLGTKEWLSFDNAHNRVDPKLAHIHPAYDQLKISRKGDLVARFGIPTDRVYSTELKYDHRGFRNDQDFQQSAVVVIGNSYVEGWNVQVEDRFASRLGAELGVNVCALGQSGYGPQQKAEVLRRFALELQPQVVIWVFFEGNDLRDAERFTEFKERWDSVSAARSRYRKRSFVRNAWKLVSRKMKRSRPIDSAEAQSRLGWIGIKDTEVPLYFGYLNSELTNNEKTYLSIAQANWVNARNICLERDSQFMLVFVPTKLRVCKDYCRFSDHSIVHQHELNDLPDRIRDWAADKKIDLVDLTEPLSQKAATGHSPYFSDDTHWNESGHEIAAKVLAQYMRTRYDVDSWSSD